ncbi:MAG: hypothetical protein AAF211_14675 [Myxococcota bacterium]
MGGGPLAAALRDLPLERWATRFVEGSVQISGRLPEPVETTFDGVAHTLETGMVRIDLDFVGGEGPAFTKVTLAAPRCAVSTDDAAGIGPVIDALHDVGICVEARTDHEVQVTLGHGIEATIPQDGTITMSAAVEGPPETPVLAAALHVQVDGTGIGVRHRQARWLDGLARIRIRRVSLHPDGQVEFDGGAAGMMDWAVTNGLKRASSSITELVKDSPRFERLRAFLRIQPSGSGLG